LTTAARGEVDAGTAGDTVRGQLEGLTAPVRAQARIRPYAGESATYHAGYLAGRFLAWVESTGRALDVETATTAATYFAVVAVTIEEGRWDPTDPRLPGHTYAMVGLEERRGEPVSADTEGLLVSWLAAHAGLRPVDSAGTILGEQRKRRHSRLFPSTSRGSS
jgi:hypothetical protein